LITGFLFGDIFELKIWKDFCDNLFCNFLIFGCVNIVINPQSAYCMHVAMIIYVNSGYWQDYVD